MSGFFHKRHLRCAVRGARAQAHLKGAVALVGGVGGVPRMTSQEAQLIADEESDLMHLPWVLGTSEAPVIVVVAIGTSATLAWRVLREVMTHRVWPNLETSLRPLFLERTERYRQNAERGSGEQLAPFEPPRTNEENVNA